MRILKRYKGSVGAIQVCRERDRSFEEFFKLSRFSSESNQIIEIDQIHPSLDVLARSREGADPAKEKKERLRVAVRGPPDHVFAPLFDFPRRRLMARIRLQPFENLA